MKKVADPLQMIQTLEMKKFVIRLITGQEACITGLGIKTDIQFILISR